ncbi:MAG: ABC transporter substrate-binding protein [Halanaerobium sp.]|nr:ABC transporter substrate-binding protein [Halanaerobium sp.]
MKHCKLLLLLVLMLCISTAVFAEQGPKVDKIYFDVRMQESIGIQDTAEGKVDVFMYGLDGPHVVGLNQSTLENLDIYTVPSGQWSINLNSIPNKAPYTWTVDGKEHFNPMAIKGIRFALNFLINRQYVVDEILSGAGGPMYGIATPGQPGTYKYNLVATKFGFTAEGDEEYALSEIDKAMNAAAELDYNKGRLVKKEGLWYYDNEPVTLKFVIRVDDPQGRMRLGEYVARQLEKAGFTVERLLYDRVKSLDVVYYGDPADYGWNLYTEAWGAGATRAFWEHIVAQMYAPWYGYMPGGANPDNWNYEHERLGELTLKAYSGDFLTEEEYWDIVLEAQEIALDEAMRLYICYQNQYFVANQDRMQSRMAYGLGDGLNKWSLVTAETEDGILRATQFSAMGGLFMGAWDPVGADGFNDVFSGVIADPMYDPSMFESPATAIHIANRAVPLEVKSEVHRDEATEEVVGDLPVPENAISYDPINDKWVEVGPGQTSMSMGEYEFRLSNYHHGVMMSLVDFLYADAFLQEWVTEDYDGDPYYCPEYSSKLGPDADVLIGSIYDFENEKVTTYFDYNFPPSMERVASWGAPSISVTASGMSIGVCWEVVETLSRLVVDGGASGTVYTFSSSAKGAEEVDVLRPSCIEDIKAELKEMIAEGYVPVSIKDFITAEEAVKRYQAALDFIEEYGHAYISNGPFYMSEYDPDTNFIELSAFRDPTYPFDTDYWVNEFTTDIIKVDNITIPTMEKRGDEIFITLNISEFTYPNIETRPNNDADVTILFVTDEKEYEFKANKVDAGVYVGRVPGEFTAELEPGTYNIVVIASKEGSVPSSASQMLVIY